MLKSALKSNRRLSIGQHQAVKVGHFWRDGWGNGLDHRSCLFLGSRIYYCPTARKRTAHIHCSGVICPRGSSNSLFWETSLSTYGDNWCTRLCTAFQRFPWFSQKTFAACLWQFFAVRLLSTGMVCTFFWYFWTVSGPFPWVTPRIFRKCPYKLDR